MNRRDFLKQLGLIATLPLIPGLFQSTQFPTKVSYLDGRVAMVWVVGEALPDEQIEALYQESRRFFE